MAVEPTEIPFAKGNQQAQAKASLLSEPEVLLVLLIFWMVVLLLAPNTLKLIINY